MAISKSEPCTRMATPRTAKILAWSRSTTVHPASVSRRSIFARASASGSGMARFRLWLSWKDPAPIVPQHLRPLAPTQNSHRRPLSSVRVSRYSNLYVREISPDVARFGPLDAYDRYGLELTGCDAFPSRTIPAGTDAISARLITSKGHHPARSRRNSARNRLQDPHGISDFRINEFMNYCGHCSHYHPLHRLVAVGKPGNR